MNRPHRGTPAPNPANLSSPLFLVKITDDGAAPEYEFVEAWYSGGAWIKRDSGRLGSAGNRGVALDGVTFAVDDYALARSGDGTGGLKWELLPLASGGGSIPSGIEYLAGDVSLTLGTAATVLTLNLPSAGTYLLTGVISGIVTATLAAGQTTYILASLRVAGGTVGGTSHVFVQAVVSDLSTRGTGTFSLIYVAPGAVSVEMRALATGLPGTIDILGLASGRATQLSYLKLA